MPRRDRNEYRRQMAERAATAPIPARQSKAAVIDPAALPRTTPGTGLTPRERKLRRNVARLPGAWNDPLRELTYEIVDDMPMYSVNSDRDAVRTFHQFATWVRRLEGSFDVATQMDDPRIAAWVDAELAHLKETSRHSAWLVLRRIRDGAERPEKRMSSRSDAAAPYTAMEWLRFEATVANLLDDNLVESGRMLLDLTGGCGLRGGEAFRTQGTHIITDHGTIYVQAINADGAIRDIPVIGPAAERLARHAGNPDYLINPRRTCKRANTLNDIASRINKKTKGGFTFRAGRARHTWLVALATQPIPFPLIAHIADLQPGSHNITDLLPHMTTMTSDDASRAAAAYLTKAGAR